MAERKKRIFHDENTRLKIQTSQIINRLTKHILAKPEIVDGKLVIKDLMSQSQVTAALGILKKTLPDLSSVQVDANVTTNSHEEALEALENGASTESRITH